MGLGNGSGRGPGALLGTEVCAALLLLCWLCCWPDDSNSDGSSTPENPRNPGRYPKKPVLFESSSRKRSKEYISRHIGNSAVSLHLPSTSGYAKSISAHRSHEEIRSRDKTHHETINTPETRYHSAPSVIDEVLHRRDWERSTRDLYIPLNPDREAVKCDSTPSLDLGAAPYAEPESSSVECLRPNDHASNKVCKKHYTNIKSSKGRKCKESNKDDIKDTDATEVEVSNFYIGDEHEDTTVLRASPSPYEDGRPPGLDDFIECERMSEERTRSIYKAKDAKQSFNESIRLKEMPKTNLVPVTEGEVRSFDFGFRVVMYDDIEDVDRSGAVHHTIESRMSLRPYPAPSVETVGYEGGACYLAEAGSVSELRGRIAGSMSPHAASALGAALAEAAPGPRSLRARHASDGDILAPPHRPESGAFSESDLDLDVDSEEVPPDYDEVQLYASPEKKETAI